MRRKRWTEKFSEYQDSASESNESEQTYEESESNESSFDDDQHADDARVFEYYEASSSKASNPKQHNGVVTHVFRSKLTKENRNQTTPRHRRKPSQHSENYQFADKDNNSKEAGEVDDLTNDQYFYDQLEKNKFTTESSDEIESVGPTRSKVNRKVVYYQGGKDAKSGKQRYSESLTTLNDDLYDDYGDIETAKYDEVEDMHERRPVEQSPLMDSIEQIDDLKREKARCNSSCRRRQPHRFLPKTRFSHKRLPRPIRISTPHKKSEQITVTKKLNHPEELHEEIDKILLAKKQNYEKRGHDKSHWELRIVPSRYDDYIDSV